MGLTIKRVDVNDAAGLTQDRIVKSEGNKLYRTLKVSTIPITGDYELTKWDLIVRGVLDWAGTLSDPFGTNEHPELLDVVQILWDKCLPERKEDVTGNASVKKVVRHVTECSLIQLIVHEVNDRLNEWRSAIGKKAIQVLNDHIKTNASLRNNTNNVATFASDLLPSPRASPRVFPLIYSHPEVCTCLLSLACQLARLSAAGI